MNITTCPYRGAKKISKLKLTPIDAFQNIRLDCTLKPNTSASIKSYIKKTGKIRGKYRTYTAELKMEAMKLYEKFHDRQFVSSAMGVPVKNIDRWIKHGVIRKKGGCFKSWKKINGSKLRR